MRIPKQLATIVIAAAVAGVVSFGAGAVVVASATVSSVTAPSWFGCLSTAGELSKVGTVAPKCSGSNPPISWNSYPSNANGVPRCTGFFHPGVDLSGCDLRSNSLFDGSNLTGADLSGANLGGGLTLGSNQTADFANANLSGANLTGDDLSDAAFDAANMANANLRGAFHSGGTTWALTQMVGTIWRNTTCPDGTNSSDYSPQTCIGHGL